MCSRQYSELGYGIKPYEFIRCQENGNFEPFQNAVNHSYCVDVESGEMKELPVTKEKKQQLSCCMYLHYQKSILSLFPNYLLFTSALIF